MRTLGELVNASTALLQDLNLHLDNPGDLVLAAHLEAARDAACFLQDALIRADMYAHATASGDR